MKKKLAKSPKKCFTKKKLFFDFLTNFLFRFFVTKSFFDFFECQNFQALKRSLVEVCPPDVQEVTSILPDIFKDSAAEPTNPILVNPTQDIVIIPEPGILQKKTSKSPKRAKKSRKKPHVPKPVLERDTSEDIIVDSGNVPIAVPVAEMNEFEKSKLLKLTQRRRFFQRLLTSVENLSPK